MSPLPWYFLSTSSVLPWQGQPKRQTSSCHSLVRQLLPFASFIICFTGDRSPQVEARQTVGYRSLVAKYRDKRILDT